MGLAFPNDVHFSIVYYTRRQNGLLEGPNSSVQGLIYTMSVRILKPDVSPFTILQEKGKLAYLQGLSIVKKSIIGTIRARSRNGNRGISVDQPHRAYLRCFVAFVILDNAQSIDSQITDVQSSSNRDRVLNGSW